MQNLSASSSQYLAVFYCVYKLLIWNKILKLWIYTDDIITYNHIHPLNIFTTKFTWPIFHGDSIIHICQFQCAKEIFRNAISHIQNYRIWTEVLNSGLFFIQYFHLFKQRITVCHILCIELQGKEPVYTKIGTYEMTSGLVTINESLLDWGPYNWTYQKNTSIPKHICSAPCPAAHFKVVGIKFCCWKCFACRNNEVLVDNGTSCEECPEKQWPADEQQIECAAIPHTFLTWGNVYGTLLAGSSSLGILLTIIISVIIIRKSNLRVVKGAGLQMLLVILAGMYLAFATVFAHIDKPTEGLCIFGRAGFHFSFTLLFGPMLVKTNRIFQVFFASAKLSTKVFMGSEFSQRVALSVIFAVQVNCFLIWLPFFLIQCKNLRI